MTGFLYKYACFDCRIGFKRPVFEDVSYGSAHRPDSDTVHVCPNCGNRMAFMGRNFSTPAKGNYSGWSAAKLLWEAGFRFVGSGYHTDPALPRKKQDVAIFIKENPNHYQRVGGRFLWEKYR